MPVKGNPENLYLGRMITVPAIDFGANLRKQAEARFDFVAVDLAAPGGQGVGADFQPSVVSDLILDGNSWNEKVLGIVSAIATPGAPGLLETELHWAAHLGLRGVLLSVAPGSSSSLGLYARAVNELLLSDTLAARDNAMQLGLRVPVTSWLAWNRFRTLCDHHIRLVVAIEFSEGASLPVDERELARWSGEPVRWIIFHQSAFKFNKNGYPVLPKRIKAFLLDAFKQKDLQVIISGSTDEADLTQHVSYVAQLFQSRAAPSKAEQFGSSHADRLQAPLQPLADHLESQTYAVFEQDPVKYVQYEEAIVNFLVERRETGRTAQVVMVLGAGRGPLVQASLQAARRAGVEVSVWAIEKNPNAVHTLRHRQRTEQMWAHVQIVASDMRTWDAPQKADCIVSELLGSFGDNELSPECLDGAQRFLAEDAVSIPQSYVSSVAPVTACKVWDDVRSYDDLAHFEMGYVVNLQQHFLPAGVAKDCFEFHHPNWSLSSNDRDKELEFEAEADALVHGFAGYFDCELYHGVRISIKPETFSEGMFSWFPLFIPLKVPVFLRKGELLKSHWWRRHDSKKVWYEWALSEPAATPIHNAGGRSWEIAL